MIAWSDWYTDTVDVYRVVDTVNNNLTRKERTLISSGNACRVYRPNHGAIAMSQTAATVRADSMLACGVDVDICAGDELIVHRGAALGRAAPDMRYFAAEPTMYFEPFGAVLPGLEHQEIRLLNEERV